MFKKREKEKKKKKKKKKRRKLTSPFLHSYLAIRRPLFKSHYHLSDPSLSAVRIFAASQTIVRKPDPLRVLMSNLTRRRGKMKWIHRRPLGPSPHGGKWTLAADDGQVFSAEASRKVDSC